MRQSSELCLHVLQRSAAYLNRIIRSKFVYDPGAELAICYQPLLLRCLPLGV